MMSSSIRPLPITAFTATSGLGVGLHAQLDALQAGRSALQPAGKVQAVEAPGWVARVTELESLVLPNELQAFACRNNQLAWLALQQDQFLQRARAAVQGYGADRVAVFMGTSTSGIAATEQAYQQIAPDFAAMPAHYSYQHSHNVHAIGEFVARAIGATGPAYTISTACSSSAKVFASAVRALNADLCDAVVVGGVDTLCLTTLFGFHALQLVSEQPCRPADAKRNGISIGEAGAFALLDPDSDADFALYGYGESSDAHHMSTPDPEARGAAMAMQSALARAQLSASDIDYVNLHGTGTRSNDASEDVAIQTVLGAQTACSSTKGFSGHCLGAAGALEAVFSLLAIQAQTLWPSLNTQQLDPELGSAVQLQMQPAKVHRVLSNSFGFGGTNCSLLLGDLG